MNLDSIVRGFYASLFVGAIAAMVWGFLAVSLVGLPGWVVLGAWAAGFVIATGYYSQKDDSEERKRS